VTESKNYKNLFLERNYKKRKKNDEIRLIKIEDFTNFENKLEISFEAKGFF